MYDTLEAIRVDLARRMKTAAQDRRSAMHAPVVGTADGDLRVMVLRAFDADAWTMRFHTDARSPKVDAIGGGASVSVLLYDPEAKIQIRARGTGRIERSGAQADAAWNEANNFARRCYLAERAPGAAASGPTSGLPAEVEGIEPSDDQLTGARENFAVLLIALEQLDWLYLDHTGHRRAQFDLRNETARWVVP